MDDKSLYIMLYNVHLPIIRVPWMTKACILYKYNLAMSGMVKILS